MKTLVQKNKDGAARGEAHTGAMKRIALIEDDADIAYTIVDPRIDFERRAA